jgi:hypothetical protein
MVFAEWAPPPKFFKLFNSPYITNYYDDDKKDYIDTSQGGYYNLKPGAPPEIVKLNKEYNKLVDAHNAYCRKTGIYF